MLRMLSFVVAVAAILVMPLSQADARGGRGGGWSGHHGFSGHFSGGRAFVGGPRFAGRGFIGPRRVFFGRRRFFGGPIFVAGGGCWRWRPTIYGWARVWVCGPWY